jgi:zinc protease
MKKTILYFLALITIFSACSEKKEETKSSYQFETVANDPLDVKIYTLKNGLKVYMSINKDEPRIQTAIAVKAGSKNDPSDATGLAHYLEHMLFKGTSKLGSLDWEKEKVYLQQISDLYEQHRATKDSLDRIKIYSKIDSLSYLAAKLVAPNEFDKIVSALGGQNTNAFTSVEQTVYINDIPSNELEKFLILESERFSELVLRIFHTELETVYEEFNRGQDNDYWKTFHAFDRTMFKKHPYGTQTTIGTSEHLKNPSMEKIHEYFNTYYVPNNMAICLAGDIDPEKTIEWIEKYFGDMKSKEVPKFTYEKEEPITQPEIVDVYGPMSEWTTIGYRFPGTGSEEIPYLEVLSGVLSNGQAGLMDLNLLQKQKLIGASASVEGRKDYTIFEMSGNPKSGQTLEETKALLLAQIDSVKQGKFDDWLIDAVIKDMKLSDIRNSESNRQRAAALFDAFIMEKDWADYVNRYEKLEKVTKQGLIDFCNKNFNENYIVINKRNGKDETVSKVAKPKITPLDINRDTSSTFKKMLDSIPSQRLEPIYVDYKKEIEEKSIKGKIPYSHVANTTNDLFMLEYILDMGTDNMKEIGLAVDYLQYLGTDKYSPEEIQKELFKLGLYFDVYSSNDQVYVYLGGLKESFEDGVKLFEHLINNAQPNEDALKELINDELKNRADQKKNKFSILYTGLYQYAVYGKNSPVLTKLSNSELTNLSADKLTDIVKSITKYNHKVYYYGPHKSDEVVSVLEKEHITPETLLAYPEKAQREELEINKNQVFFVDYDMVQTEILMVAKGDKFNPSIMPYAMMFNEYFGSGLSSIVFQEIRETKALAYSAYAAYRTPSKKEKSYYLTAYVGTQADKLNNAVDAMLELMNNMPKAEKSFESSKLAALKQIETNRTSRSRIYWSRERANDLGFDYDYKKDNYEAIKKISVDDLAKFFEENIKGKNYTFLVIGNKKNVNKKELARMGEVKELKIDDVLGN